MTIPAGEVAELLQTLIRNACVNDGTPESGHEIRSVESLDAYLGVTGVRFEKSPERVTASYRVPGHRAAPTLTLMGHLDVVPATADAWTVDPFSGERRDGIVWGRGAIDMLDQTAAMAAVFKRCLTGELRYPGDLVLLAVADEENGGRLGARWLVEEHWDAVATDFLLTEIGTPALVGRGGAGIPVTVAEKGPQWRRLHARGEPAHGSQPYATRNSLVSLADAVTRLVASPPSPHMSPEWLRFVRAWDPPHDLALDLVDPVRIGAAIDRIARDDLGLARWIHACTHLTASPNVLHAGVKANVVPDRGVLEIDVRTLPGQDHTDVLAHFRAAIGSGFEDFDYEVVESTPASGSPPEGPLWDALSDAASVVAPGRHLIPAMIPVGTDARFFRRRGVVAYGVGVFDDRIGFGDFLRMFHGHDERVSEASLGLTADLYVKAVERLSQLV